MRSCLSLPLRSASNPLSPCSRTLLPASCPDRRSTLPERTQTEPPTERDQTERPLERDLAPLSLSLSLPSRFRHRCTLLSSLSLSALKLLVPSPRRTLSIHSSIDHRTFDFCPLSPVLLDAFCLPLSNARPGSHHSVSKLVVHPIGNPHLSLVSPRLRLNPPLRDYP
jgi:hypothetical protein